MMNSKLQKLLFASGLLASLGPCFSIGFAQGTVFTYQGRLSENGSLAAGDYDMQFRLYDAPQAGNQISFTLQVAPLSVSNGLFTASLTFGSSAFGGGSRWLEISVRRFGSTNSFSLLSPRQPLTPTPYAMYAGNAERLGGGTAATFVAKNGDTMSGPLNLPPNGLLVGTNQLIISGGNVGVGTASPANKLAVAGDANFSGNVGIGTASPLAPLEIFSAPSVFGSSDFLRIAYGPSDYHSIQAFFNGNPGNSSLSFNVEHASGDIRRVMTMTGDKIGIGTASPGAKLDVRGDVKLGPAGQEYAVSGAENLRIIRGSVSADATSRVGAGYSVSRTFEYFYRVTFDTPFAGPPSVVVMLPNPNGAVAVTCCPAPPDSTGFHLYFEVGVGNSPRPFDFIAIGPR